jgi:hypothetical protein
MLLMEAAASSGWKRLGLVHAARGEWRPALVALGKAALLTPPPDVSAVKGPGSVEEELPARPRWRPATGKEIDAWISQLGTEQAAQAGRALELTGPAALPALERAREKAGTPEREALAGLIQRISLDAALLPPRVGLKLTDVPLPKAIEILAGKTDLPLAFQGVEGKTVTLALNDVPPWEAVDRLARKAGLTWGNANFNMPRPLVPGQMAPEERIAYAGPLRLQPLMWYTSGNLGLADPAAPRNQNLYLMIEVMVPPGGAFARVHHPRLTEVKDGADKDVELLAAAAGNNQPVPSTLFPLTFQVQVKPEVLSHRTVKLLRGVLPLDLVVGRRELAVLVDPGQDVRQRVPLSVGGRLAVSARHSFGGTQRLMVELTGLTGWRFDPQRHGFELVDANGKRHRAQVAGLAPQFGARPATVDDLSLLGPGIPWPALGRYSATLQPGANLQGSVDFILAALPAGSKLVLVELATKKVDVPFAFQDLPLP